jgi:hypothetical protein
MGSMYTAPWDTQDGVTFRWNPDESDTDDVVSVTVRFLGPVDLTNDTLVDPFVAVSANPSIEAAWGDAQAAQSIPSDAPVPLGYRPALPCDDPDRVEWMVDPGLRTQDGGYQAVAQGDPNHTMVEMTCRIEDQDGEFVLTRDILQPALDYADLHGAEGAIFYFSRTEMDRIPTPDVRDRFGNKHEISDLVYVSNSIELGRFWYDR